MQVDWSINIPTLIAIGAAIAGLVKMHASYVKVEFKVNELWQVHRRRYGLIDLDNKDQ